MEKTMSFENRKDGRVVSMGASMEIFWLAAGLGRQLYARATKHLGEEGRRQVVCEMVGLAVAIFLFFTKFDYKDSNQAVLNNPSLVNSNDQPFQPFPVRREDGRFTTTGTNSILPLGGV